MRSQCCCKLYVAAAPPLHARPGWPSNSMNSTSYFIMYVLRMALSRRRFCTLCLTDLGPYAWCLWIAPPHLHLSPLTRSHHNHSSSSPSPSFPSLDTSTLLSYRFSFLPFHSSSSSSLLSFVYMLLFSFKSLFLFLSFNTFFLCAILTLEQYIASGLAIIKARLDCSGIGKIFRAWHDFVGDRGQGDGAPHGRSQGEIPPPERGKIVVENGVISEGSIFSNNFSKNNLKFYFLIEFLSKIFKISQNFPTICVFRPNARKINALFVKLFW